MFNSEFFAGCHTLQEVKARFKALVKVHHPDVGGDTATMQRLNDEYSRMIDYIAKHGEIKADREAAAAEVPAEYAAAVAATINLKGVILEMVGSWIWASGNTYPHREALKAAGFRWSSKRKIWYYRPETEGYTGHSKKSNAWIKAKYNAERITTDTRTSRAAIAY